MIRFDETFKFSHQLRGPVSVFLSFSASLSISACCDPRIAPVVLFRKLLYIFEVSGSDRSLLIVIKTFALSCRSLYFIC